MTDIPQLEHALIQAAGRRVRRRLPPVRAAFTLAAGAAAATAFVVAVQSIGGDAERVAQPPQPPELTALIGRVLTETEVEPGCALVKQPARLVDEQASAATRDAFAVLRRPAREGDAIPEAWLAPPLAGRDVLARSVRRVRAADGAAYVLVVSRGPLAVRLTDPDACAARRRAAFDELAAGASPALIRRGHEILEEQAGDAPAGPGREQLELHVLNPDGTRNDAAFLDAATVARRGLYRPTATSTDGGPLQRTLAGVVPDEVATVRIGGDGDGRPHTPPAAVQDNLFHVALPAGIGPDLVVTWRDRDARVIRRVPFAVG